MSQQQGIEPRVEDARRAYASAPAPTPGAGPAVSSGAEPAVSPGAGPAVSPGAGPAVSPGAGPAVSSGAGPATPATSPADAPPAKRKRGRESAGDMVRSLGVVLVLVLVMWFLAQASPSDEQPRVVDQSADVAALRDAAPAAPVPTGLPDAWQPQVSDYSAAPDQLRLGWRTPSQQYAEYAAVVGLDGERLQELVGTGRPLDRVQIDGASWERYRSGDALSFARSTGGVTVVVGTVRASAGEDELRTLVGALRTGPGAP